MLDLTLLCLEIPLIVKEIKLLVGGDEVNLDGSVYNGKEGIRKF